MFLEGNAVRMSGGRETMNIQRTVASSPRWHFQVKHLFGLTTIAAIAAALVARWGLGTLLTSAGFLVAWLNVCGAFQGLQKDRRQAVLLWLAWAIFLISLALPSLTVFGPVYGYGAAWFAITVPLEVIHSDFFRRQIVWYLAVDVANVLAALLPLLIWRLHCGRGHWIAAALALSMVATWFPCWDSHMLVGYFVWYASFLVMLIAIPVRARTLAAMVGMAILVCLSLKGVR